MNWEMILMSPALFCSGQNEFIYRIYSINRPGRLLNFGPWEGALIRGGRLFEAGRLLNCHHFQQV